MRGGVQLTTDANTNGSAEGQPEEKPQRQTRARRPAREAQAPRARQRRTPAAAAPEPDATDEPGQSAADPVRRQRRSAAPQRGRIVVEQKPPPRLMARYRDEIRAQLVREFGYGSPMEAPRLSKVVVNVGLGEGLTNARALETAPEHVAAITGQRPVITRARKSVAGFKVREGQSIGVMTTLRGRRMYEFVDRMIATALPRIRDFRGVPRHSFDGRGNYALGFREQVVFPEIDYGSIDRVRGFQVVIATTAQTDAEGLRLLELMGMPFARQQTN